MNDARIQGGMELTECTWFVDVVDATAAFYERLLGTGPARSWPGGVVFEECGVTFLIHETYDPAPADLPPEDHVAFAVEDLDAELERLARAGLAVERGPETFDWGRSAYLRDPGGNLLELAEQ